MHTWLVELVVVAIFALACGALVAAWKRGRLGTAAIALFAVALVAWVCAFVAIATEFHGANDFATCDPDCGAVHYVSAVAFILPPLLISLAALGMLLVRGGRWRARRSAARENHA